MLKVALSPVYDKYLGLNDLEKELSLTGLLDLMPTDSGARRAFFRTIKRLETEQGVKFKVEKETRRDIVWSIKQGRKNLGSYMLVYGNKPGSTVPLFAGSKPRTVPKAKTEADTKLFDALVAELNATLWNPDVNSYTFHLKVRDWMKTHAAVIEPRETGAYQIEKQVKSWYYYMDEQYRSKIEHLSKIYSMFKMHLTWEEVND